MFGRIIVALILILTVLLFSLWYNNKKPDQGNLDNVEYEKKLGDHYCSYNATRNTLLLGLVLALAVGLVRTLRVTSGIIGGKHKDTLVEDVEFDEVDIFA
jgi:hypothetical protein